MPSSRDRNRASGTSSCESGKKKMRLPCSASAVPPAHLRHARAAPPGGLQTAARDRRRPAPPACSQRVVPSAPKGNGAAEQRAPRDFQGAHGVGQERLRQQQRVLGRPPACCARRAAGSAPGRCPSASNSAELVLDHVGSAPTTSSDGARLGGRQLRHQRARQASSPCVKVVSMPLPE
jgi:hypothetical protein